MTINVAEVKKRLLGFLHDDNLVSEYIRAYGPTIDIKHIKTIKDAKTQSVDLSSSGTGNDPTFDIMVSCPVCNREEIPCYELRAKSQKVSQNKFLVPCYEGTTGYKTVDYTLIAVTVCPRCLMASPDKKDFIRSGGLMPGDTGKSQLPSNSIMTLQEKIGERKAVLKSVTNYEDYFKRPRSGDAAIASYRLCMARAATEASYEQPYSFYKMGAYALKIAKIMKSINIDNREVLTDALGFFEESYRTSNCPTEEIEMQVVYTIVALYLRLGEQKKANAYIGAFSSLHTNRANDMRDNPALTTTIIDKWTDRAKTLWEDRDRDDLFKDE